MDGSSFITTPTPEQGPNGRITPDQDLLAAINRVVERKVSGLAIRNLTAEFTGVVGKTMTAIPQEKRGDFVTRLAGLAECDAEELLPSPSKLPYTFTLFPNQYASEKAERTVTLDQVADQIRATTASDKGRACRKFLALTARPA